MQRRRFEDDGGKRLAKAASTVSTTRPEAAIAAYLDVVCVHYSIYTVLYGSIRTRHVCLPTALKATNDGHEDYVDDVDFDDDDFTVVVLRGLHLLLQLEPQPRGRFYC